MPGSLEIARDLLLGQPLASSSFLAIAAAIPDIVR
jgi:hypothetical protein